MGLQNTSATPSLDIARLSSALHKSLPFSSSLAHCAPLAGDASNRRYYRLHLSGGPVKSLILMQLSDPEGFKASEEAVSGAAVDISELPFLNVLNHLQMVGVSVPHLYFLMNLRGFCSLKILVM